MSELSHTPAVQGPDVPRALEPLEQRLSGHLLCHSIEALRDTAVSTPAWAALMCVVFGGLVPVFGTVSIYLTWPWPLFCLGMASAVYMLAQHVKQAAEDADLDGAHWTKVVASAHVVVTGSWCLVTLIFWEPGNVANHCFLVAVAIAASALFLTSRSGQFVMVVCATVPNLGMIWLHLMRGELWSDQVLAVVLPLWAIQLHYDAWRSCRTVAASHRMRFEMETLAAELARARDEAASANKAKSVFLANMSHELRTPLNAILGFAEIISTKALGTASPQRQQEYMDHILTSGRHLLRLINDVLDIAKIDAGKFVLDRRWIDGSGVLQDCVAAFADQAAAGGLVLSSSTSPEGLKVYADERAFSQIVNNLLSNAVKFTPPGGKIMVRLALVDDGAMLSIRDTGCGIPADQLPVIFQPFEPGGNNRGYGRANGGTGLGLALVHSLTELHGGTCRIDSEVDMGTLVTVFLPNAQGASAPAEPLRKIA